MTSEPLYRHDSIEIQAEGLSVRLPAGFCERNHVTADMFVSVELRESHKPSVSVKEEPPNIEITFELLPSSPFPEFVPLYLLHSEGERGLVIHCWQILGMAADRLGVVQGALGGKYSYTTGQRRKVGDLDFRRDVYTIWLQSPESEE